MSGKEIVFHPSAAEELQAAFLWYHQQNPNAASAFWQEIEQGLQKLSDMPAQYPAYVLTTRRYLLKRFPYFIIFREMPDSIEIIGVAHGRRKPGYWRGRVG